MSELFTTILFDLDGTLTDSGLGIMNCVKYALSKLGIEEEDTNKLKLFIGPPLIPMFMDTYNMTKEQAQYGLEMYRERYVPKGMQETTVYEGIPELLADLHSKGVHLGVATSKPEEFAKTILKMNDLDSYFDVIAGASMDERLVTKDDIIREALIRLNVDPEVPKGILMVGDRCYDVEGAARFKIPCVGVGFGFAPEGELEEAGAAYLAKEVSDLHSLLLKITGH